MAARLRRTFKMCYPWINTTFEVWLMLSNVAYLFDRTPFYRPWLAWVGVDIRRLGIEDYVSIYCFNLNLLLIYLLLASCPSALPKDNPRTSKRSPTTHSKELPLHTPYPLRISSSPLTHCNIFHQIPGMVVLTFITCTSAIVVSSGSPSATSKNATTSSKRVTVRRECVRNMSNM